MILLVYTDGYVQYNKVHEKEVSIHHYSHANTLHRACFSNHTSIDSKSFLYAFGGYLIACDQYQLSTLILADAYKRKSTFPSGGQSSMYMYSYIHAL